ncbi:putative C6 transcription factor [Aspergillus clavatus NRRL 1]|uniref:C6 zinc finger domain protein n=1 Tax=Aspergillus clavatus (strain ATCC 1007 / CBS 513.65 / DSM 816 / NCTC 3887 / NRRL 1 / QM 1276 / 107) TaxID=344612 RepID=A1C6P2_ASPCL|nr:C6 zinc finger domain protein [Aspergillus clavatus NRRL 1]EAW14063.1 C6 zinc finger domain protein [Aspergillus clavatus NRRL 1]
MVYGGRPSTGCYLCLKRKIRCDEASPECRNCIVYGQPCPGYRPDTIFRDETQKVQRLMKKKKPKSPPARDTSICAAEDKDQKPTLLLTRRIADATWEERSICYFFDQYTSSDDDGELRGPLGFLPALYALCRDIGEAGCSASASLRLAVDATALVTLSNEIQERSLLVKARHLYGMAIQRLRQALTSRAQAVRDETFAAVVLLSIFEDITGERNGLSSSHTVGLEVLMKLRGVNQFGHAQGRDLFNFAYAHTHTEFLVLGDKPRFKTDWISGLLDSSDPIHQLMLIASEVKEVFLESSSLQTSNEPGRVSRILSCIEHAKVVDMELAGWNQNLPEHWLPLIVYSQDHTSFMTYQQLTKAIIWNYYRAVRIVLQKVILGLHQAVASAVGDSGVDAELLQEEPKILGVIQEMITDVCRSIPFGFGYVDALGNAIPAPSEGKLPIRAFQGLSMVWPLWYILSCGLATPEQSHQVRTVLARVGSTLGIKMALILAKEGDAHDLTAVHNEGECTWLRDFTAVGLRQSFP